MSSSKYVLGLMVLLKIDTIRTPRKLIITIDNCRMRSHPDLALSLHSKGTLSEIVVEVGLHIQHASISH